MLQKLFPWSREDRNNYIETNTEMQRIANVDDKDAVVK